MLIFSHFLDHMPCPSLSLLYIGGAIIPSQKEFLVKVSETSYHPTSSQHLLGSRNIFAVHMQSNYKDYRKG